ncbi:hypothetical protein Emag_006961 [Eimeria magna]
MRSFGRWRLLPLLLGVLILTKQTEAQLRVQSPKRLFDQLVVMKAISKDSYYTLIGSTASFGTPAGRAFYVPDPVRTLADKSEAGHHCDPSYCVQLKASVDEWKSTQLQGGLGHVVFFVDRGICTFAAKVEVAQSCGADAVVVVDQGKQGWTREIIRHNIIMSDDGKARNIRTPSILIAQEEGDAFEREILSGEEPVLVELEWKMPSQWPVAVKLWADPGDMQAAGFLQALAPYMLRLGPHVRFQTIFNVFSLSGGSEELCLSEGLYAKYPRLYCSFEPNAQVLGLTGSEVVQEALLESCLYWTTKTSVPGMADAEYSREWWLYQQRLGDPKDGCFFTGKGQNAWGPACSRRVLSEVLSSGKLRAVELCMSDESGRRLLDFSKNNRGWSVVAMTINGARYSGQLEAEPVLRAICSATMDPTTSKYRAEECNDIVVFLYYRYAKQQFVERMQRRVQHEVQQQLQLYHRMDEQPGKGGCLLLQLPDAATDAFGTAAMLLLPAASAPCKCRGLLQLPAAAAPCRSSKHLHPQLQMLAAAASAVLMLWLQPLA